MKSVMKYFFIAIISLMGIQLNAQKIGYVDTDLILSKMPEYKAAQKQLDDLSVQWQGEAQKMKDEIDQLFREYQAEEVLLTPDQKKVKQDAIVKKEQELFTYRENKFGSNGELFKKREELIKPIQDKVFEAVQKVAKNEGLAFMFDKAGGVLMLYADAKYDKTLEVMEALGIPTDDSNSPTNDPQNSPDKR